jgi:dTDP-4-dehydrorhamnose reductase
MLNLLITGSNGQLGSEIKEVASEFRDKINYFFVTRDTLDLENEAEVESFFAKNSISAILNTAAYTAVDLAESEFEKANIGNVKIPNSLSKLAYKHNMRFVHISTDFVFNGKACLPYREEDPTDPVSIYGKSKAAGEKAVLSANPDSCIIRTSWVYSKYGNNFVKTMRRLGIERSELKVIFDQIGSPTWARDLARTALQMLLSRESGIFHYSNEGVASWYDFAKEILELSGLKTKILPIETKDYPTAAIRPSYSVLNKSKIKNTLRLDIPHWKDSLKVCIEEFKGN